MSGRVPAPLVFAASAFSQYLGAGLAVSLFSLMPSTTVAWWRLVVGAVVLLALRRPWRRSWTRRALALAAAFGTATATMNVIFYAAISLLPLGTVVSLEFLGPVAVAAVTGRGWRPRLAARRAPRACERGPWGVAGSRAGWFPGPGAARPGWCPGPGARRLTDALRRRTAYAGTSRTDAHAASDTRRRARGPKRQDPRGRTPHPRLTPLRLRADPGRG